MKHSFWIVLVLSSFVPSYGQGALSSYGKITPSAYSRHAFAAKEPPQSSVDLVKKLPQTEFANTKQEQSSADSQEQIPTTAKQESSPTTDATASAVTTPKKLSPAAAQRVAVAKQKREEVASQAVEKKEDSAAPSDSQAIPPDSQAVAEDEESAADAELELAVKMLEESKKKAQSMDRPIPPSAAQNRPSKVPVPNRKFNPNEFRPGVTWQESKSTHFDIYTQKRSAGIPSANMSMTFEAAYQTLRRFIPWMMSDRVRVFIYQDHASYLRHEPNAKAWTRALAYPTRGEVVVYDEPGKQRELKEVFTHELTHIFTQQFFDSHKTGRIMTPTWLDEGLAVFMEDQTAGAKGGPWARDLRVLHLRRDPSQEKQTFGSTSLFSPSPFGRRRAPLGTKRRGKPVHLLPFETFMDEGSLSVAETRNQLQTWYLQAYAMVRFLLNPAGGTSPSNRMQFEQFTRLIAQGEAKRDPSNGFLVKDSRGKTVYEPYSVEKALGRAYHYNNRTNFEDNFWRWIGER